jgi:hypothetical protein
MENSSSDRKTWKQEVLGALVVGWKAMKINFLVLFFIQLILFFLQLPVEQFSNWEFVIDASHSFEIGILSILYSIFFYSVIYASSHLVFLRGVRGEKISLRMLLDGFSNYLNILLATIVTFGLIVISLLFLIVPGIYVTCRLAFVVYLVTDEGMGPKEAIEASWRITKGHVSKLLALVLVNIPFALVIALPLGLMFGTGAGIDYLGLVVIPVAVWTKAALAALYLSVTEQPQPQLKHPEITLRSVLTLVFSMIAVALLVIVLLTLEPF